MKPTPARTSQRKTAVLAEEAGFVRNPESSPVRSGDIQKLVAVAQDFARKQIGVVARRQLLMVGIPGSTIDHRIGSLLFPLFPGVYAVGRPQVSQEGLWMAGVLTAGEGGVLAGRSAAAAWGFMKVTPAVEVVRVGNRRILTRRIEVDGAPASIPLIIRGTRKLRHREISRVGLVPVVSPARALVGMAPNLTPAALKRGFIEADRLGLLSEEDLAACADAGRGHPGAVAFRRLAGDRIPDLLRAKSLLEGLMLEACHLETIAPPEVNVYLGGHEVDFVWRDRRVAVELDSYEFHRGREKFEEDLVRNNRIWAAGWVLLRFTWRRVTREPDQVIEEVRNALRLAPPSGEVQ